MREQTQNQISYNIPQMLYWGVFIIKDLIRYSLAADYFDESLETINDLIQGPNLPNLSYSIDYNFSEVCRVVLDLYSKYDITHESLNEMYDTATWSFKLSRSTYWVLTILLHSF